MTKRVKTARSSKLNEKQTSLPALSALRDVPSFDQLVPTQAQRDAYGSCVECLQEAGVSSAQLELACVVRLDRGFPAVVSSVGVFRAEFSARVTKGDNSKVAVGDWVCARIPLNHDMGIIEAILPRKSEIARWRGSARGEKQTLAANVDVTFVVQALDERKTSIDRIVRSVVIALDSNVRAVVVLTKADSVSPATLKRYLTLIHEVLGDAVTTIVTSSKLEVSHESFCDEMKQIVQRFHARWGMDAIREEIPQESVAIVLGESGAGKSTLLNALLGHEALETGEVRASDKAGRHTTVARRMVALPKAGIIVDEPGLRSLPVVGHEQGLTKVFPRISRAAAACKFRDCTHVHEPGCGVREALRAGECSSAQVDAYLSLAHEMQVSSRLLDPDVVL